MGTEIGPVAPTERPQLAPAVLVEAATTDRLRVILAAGMVPVLAGITLGMSLAGIDTTSWLVLIVAPTLSLVIGWILTGRIAAVAHAAAADQHVAERVMGKIVSDQGAKIDATRALVVELAQEGPPPTSGDGPSAVRPLYRRTD